MQTPNGEDYTVFNKLKTWIEKRRESAERRWRMSLRERPVLTCDQCGNTLPRWDPSPFIEGSCCGACRKVWCLRCQPRGIKGVCPSCGKPVDPV